MLQLSSYAALNLPLMGALHVGRRQPIGSFQIGTKFRFCGIELKGSNLKYIPLLVPYVLFSTF